MNKCNKMNDFQFSKYPQNGSKLLQLMTHSQRFIHLHVNSSALISSHRSLFQKNNYFDMNMMHGSAAEICYVLCHQIKRNRSFLASTLDFCVFNGLTHNVRNWTHRLFLLDWKILITERTLQIHLQMQNE